MGMDHFDVVIVGAGFGGIGAAIQVKRLGYENIVILDREADLGGTWHVNRYPGLAVDVACTTYSYWFEPNPGWSRLFPPGAELQQYAAQVAEKYDVRRHMWFNTTVEGARWDDEARVWPVALAGGESLTARLLITATGFLSQPHTPAFAGIESFQGNILHTAAWDDGHDLGGRRVGIIGTGATAVQLVPELAARAADLTVYQRTPIHVLPKLDFAFPPWLQRLFARVPLTQRALRLLTDVFFELVLIGALHHRGLRRLNIAASDLAKINRFVWIRDKELRRKLTPDYDFGCKRPTWSNSYYRALTKPHVHLETSGIERIGPDGIVTADGKKAVLDTLVLATGFDLWEANFPAFEVIGRNGRNLGKWWRENRFQAYQGVTIPFFPNYLSLVSPY
ncbi:MAG: NAD(P)/FAD-dependent oxidoreductase, partial [Mycobacterium sp.]|nr:NAD(P)/FAD-dependent oxidoreductase [Mycobacterium sp.]